MKSKLIEYAYPSSILADNNGFNKTGCWFVSYYEHENSCKRVKIIKFFLAKNNAIKFAETLPEPFNFMHKYFNN